MAAFIGCARCVHRSARWGFALFIEVHPEESFGRALGVAVFVGGRSWVNSLRLLVRFMRVRWGAPLCSSGSCGERPGACRVHAGSQTSLVCALGVFKFIRSLWVQWGTPWDWSGFFVVRLCRRRVHPGSLGTLRWNVWVVVCRWVHWGTQWGRWVHCCC